MPLQGTTYDGITQALTKEGVPTPGGKAKWSIIAVRSKYRKVIWRCNRKYDGKSTCRTPHLTNGEIQATFLSVANRLLAAKAEVVENGRAMTGIQDAQTQRSSYEAFLDAFEKLPEAITDLTPDIWCALVDHATVYTEDDIRFTFKSGQEVRA